MSKKHKKDYIPPSPEKRLQVIGIIQTWAEAVQLQGQRVLDNQQNQVSNVQRTMDEHFFLTAAKQLRSYVAQTGVVPGLRQAIDKRNLFSPENKTGEKMIDSVRNAREHHVNHFSGKGSRAEPSIFSDGFIVAAPTATIIMDNVALVGPDGKSTHIDKSLVGDFDFTVSYIVVCCHKNHYLRYVS